MPKFIQIFMLSSRKRSGKLPFYFVCIRIATSTDLFRFKQGYGVKIMKVLKQAIEVSANFVRHKQRLEGMKE